MNLHPIFVHFPIALLTVYTLLEVFRLPIITRQSWWFYTKAVLLFIGTLGGVASGITGKIASQGFAGTSTMALVTLHSHYAEATVMVYGGIALLYAIEWMKIDGAKIPSSPWAVILRIQSVLWRAPILVLASLIGLLLVTITGALGGALVYGPDIDPVVGFFYHLLYK